MVYHKMLERSNTHTLKKNARCKYQRKNSSQNFEHLHLKIYLKILIQKNVLYFPFFQIAFELKSQMFAFFEWTQKQIQDFVY